MQISLERAPDASLIEEPAQSSQNQRPPVDPVNMEAVEGDEDLFIEIANLFLEGQQEMLTIIQEAIRLGDGPALASGAHTLKGAAGNFSAHGVVEMSQELEKIGNSGVLDRSHEIYVRLERGRATAPYDINGEV